MKLVEIFLRKGEVGKTEKDGDGKSN
jgi:hypothetical protein